mmetsp:Transcript_60253/g.143605  ORF Transcript_60253/g.143605 Transcript_60253/m.143605 type:complete len:182 (+) Transcript_60253:75-620(+)
MGGTPSHVNEFETMSLDMALQQLQQQQGYCRERLSALSSMAKGSPRKRHASMWLPPVTMESRTETSSSWVKYMRAVFRLEASEEPEMDEVHMIESTEVFLQDMASFLEYQAVRIPDGGESAINLSTAAMDGLDTAELALLSTCAKSEAEGDHSWTNCFVRKGLVPASAGSIASTSFIEVGA